MQYTGQDVGVCPTAYDSWGFLTIPENLKNPYEPEPELQNPYKREPKIPCWQPITSNMSIDPYSLPPSL
jgi:hypothetical protein